MNQVHLKWNDFENDIRHTFVCLRKERSSFDVTLATDDGHIIEAHKIILSAGSEFFNSILKRTKHPNPFVHLKGVTKSDLESVINFLYCGQVVISQDVLLNF